MRKKFLALIISVFCGALLMTLLINVIEMLFTVILGGIPTMIIGACCTFISTRLYHLFINSFNKYEIKKQQRKENKQTKINNGNLQSEANRTQKSDRVKVSKTRFCVRCGHQLDKNRKCGNCGKQYFYPKRFLTNSKPKYCAKCGKLINKENKKCTCYKRKSKKILILIMLLVTIIVTSITLLVVTLCVNNKANELQFTREETIKSTYIKTPTEPVVNYKLSILELSPINTDLPYSYIKIQGSSYTIYTITLSQNDVVFETDIDVKRNGIGSLAIKIPETLKKGKVNLTISGNGEKIEILEEVK